MSDLEWRQTEWGYESGGYRIVGDDMAAERPWRLEPIGSSGAHGRNDRVTRHRTFEDAASWAEQAERDHLRRMTAAGHFIVAVVSLALFVISSLYIGTLHGLGIVAVMLYLTLRAAGNGLGVVLQEAWGWTRPRSKRPTVMERSIGALVAGIRRRQLAASSPPDSAKVRELAPPR